MGHEKLSDELEARQKLEEKLEVDLNGLRSGIMREQDPVKKEKMRQQHAEMLTQYKEVLQQKYPDDEKRVKAYLYLFALR